MKTYRYPRFSRKGGQTISEDEEDQINDSNVLGNFNILGGLIIVIIIIIIAVVITEYNK
jgi:hypothetical protein